MKHSSEMLVVRNLGVVALLLTFLIFFGSTAKADEHSCLSYCQGHWTGSNLLACQDGCNEMAVDQSDGFTWQEADNDCMSYCSATYFGLARTACFQGCAEYGKW